MPRKTDVRKETCREKKSLQEKDMPMESETSRKKCQDFKRKRFQGKGMPRETDVRKETCRENKRPQEKDMPREREKQEKDAKTSRERDFKEKACREKRMSGKRHVERIRNLRKEQADR